MKIHPDLVAAEHYVYKPCGMHVENVAQEPESQEYSAATFDMNGSHIKFRVSKITPTKIGQFVTLWRRINGGPIIPHDVQDNVDFFVISVRSSEGRLGQFVFSKNVLCEKGIMSEHGKGGKLAIRVYPAWDKAENIQAKRTQAWQLNYFFEIDQHKPIDISHIKKLFVL